jgi:hypothetical protein
MLEHSFLGYKLGLRAWYMFRELVLDVEKIAILNMGFLL